MTHRILRSLAAPALALAAFASSLSLSSPALAEERLLDGQFGVGSGMEGGDDGSGNIGWHRARLRVVAGLDLRSDEDEGEGWGFRAFAELEKRGSIGGEARYTFWLTRSLGAHGGVIGVVTPGTMVGAGVGATVLVPLGKKPSIFIEPSFSALPLGSDLPGDTVVMWALLTAGIRLAL